MADHPIAHQLGIRVYRGPRPRITDPRHALQVLRGVVALAVNETPDFITLYMLQFEAPHVGIMILTGKRSSIGQQAQDRDLRCTEHASGRCQRIPFDKSREDRCALFGG